MAAQGQKLDLIIFGATGFTGKEAVCQMVRIVKQKNVTWGISGRNRSKLEDVLKEVSQTTGEDLMKVPIILADVGNEESLKEMAAKTQVVVNCVGPFTFYGEVVVKSCIASGAHYVDISGEPQFLEKIQLDYHDAAQEKQVYVVGACGLDCIPTDLGVVFLQKQFPGGELNSAEIYIQAWSDNPSLSGPILNSGTFDSAVHYIGSYSDLLKIRRKLFPKPWPPLKPKLRSRFVVHKRDNLGWCIPFLGADEAVAFRTQQHFLDVEKLRPVQVKIYSGIKSFVTLLRFAFYGFIFMVLAQFSFGRNFMTKHPQFFSGGACSLDGPTEEMRKSTNYKATLYGEGWTEKMAEPTDQHLQPPNKKVVVTVHCKDPGYATTCVMILLSAITIVKEKDKMPGRGGVYTPGAAFARTTLVDELGKYDIKFEVKS